MTGSDLVALVGAAAWVPQIVRWVSKALRKPALEMISAPRVILGYTSQGPFLQITASISSQNSDVIVTRIDVLARHQSGEQRLLTWSSVTETLASFQFPTEASPVNLPMNRPQSVLAIKAITESLSERHIGFVDLDFVAEAQDKINSAREHFKYLKSESREAAVEILHAKEFKQAEQFLANSVFWREGSYLFEIKIFGKELRTPHEEVLGISLTRRDIDEILTDLSFVRESLRAQISGETLTPHQWNFVHPTVISLRE